MTLIDFIQRLLGREKPSGALARERLQLVLAHDRSDLNPELLEQMRREILEVVQKYVEIDLDSGDVSLETGDRVTALVANLPIRRARPLSTPRPAGDSGAATPESVPPATDGAGTPHGVGGREEIGAAADLPTEPVGLNAETAAAVEPGLPG
jgi:cell division topological specificity factor